MTSYSSEVKVNMKSIKIAYFRKEKKTSYDVSILKLWVKFEALLINEFVYK